MLKLFSGASVASLLVSGLIGAGVTAWPLWATAHSAGYGKAEKRHVEVERRFFDREAVLWYEVGAARQQQAEMASHFVEVIDGTEEARQAARRNFIREKQRADRAVQWVADALKEMERVENDWKGKPVPPDVIRPFCLRDGQSGCQATPSGAAGAGSVDLRGPAAGDVPAEGVSARVGGDGQ